MPKLPILKPKHIISALQRADFVIHHQTGSHVRLIHNTMPRRSVTIAIHGKDMPKGTLANVIRQSGLTAEEFLDLL